MLNPSVRLATFAILASAVIFSGCAGKKNQNQINTLQAQVGAITDELVRLDQSLQETRSAIQAEESLQSNLQGQLGASSSRLRSLREEESVIKGIYRTPSGFELPSINIQKALKNAGYYQGNLDGKIGPMTRDAVKAFQRDNGMEADGVVGRTTWNRLKAHLGIIK